MISKLLILFSLISLWIPNCSLGQVNMNSQQVNSISYVMVTEIPSRQRSHNLIKLLEVSLQFHGKQEVDNGMKIKTNYHLFLIFQLGSVTHQLQNKEQFGVVGIMGHHLVILILKSLIKHFLTQIVVQIFQCAITMGIIKTPQGALSCLVGQKMGILGLDNGRSIS